MSHLFLESVKQRRTFYELTKERIVSAERIRHIINEAVLHTPSAFNSQSARVVVLFDDQSDKLWQITKETLREIVSANNWAKTEEKITGFGSGYGTVLFYEDQSVIESLCKQFPTYADNFPVWSNQSSGMLQFVIWTALELEGLGASLQHYNPLIDAMVAQRWSIPTDWKLIAQMPFGKPAFAPNPKDFKAVEDLTWFIH